MVLFWVFSSLEIQPWVLSPNIKSPFNNLEFFLTIMKIRPWVLTSNRYTTLSLFSNMALSLHFFWRSDLIETLVRMHESMHEMNTQNFEFCMDIRFLLNAKWNWVSELWVSDYCIKTLIFNDEIPVECMKLLRNCIYGCMKYLENAYMDAWWLI